MPGGGAKPGLIGSGTGPSWDEGMILKIVISKNGEERRSGGVFVKTDEGPNRGRDRRGQTDVAFFNASPLKSAVGEMDVDMY